jgi:hypothetical protein
MMRKILIPLLVLYFALSGCVQENQIKTLVIIDSSAPGSKESKEYLLPYLDHFGIDYEIADLGEDIFKLSPADYALLIVGQDFEENRPVLKVLEKFEHTDAGILSFDADILSLSREDTLSTAKVDMITGTNHHYITALHGESDTITCFSPMNLKFLPAFEGDVLLYASGDPFLIASEYKDRKVVCFTSMDWMKTSVLGPLMGIDDCLWRSMVWAARKPFVMRGLPPLVTMRIDDVMGTGELWDQSPFYWIKIANDYGFKPWLGLFIYNLNSAAIEELRGYLLAGNASASPHAFGSPNRSNIKTLQQASYQAEYQGDYRGFYYYPEAMPLRADDYDEFIFFDHQNQKPWSDEEAKRGLEAVDQWYDRHQPLPKSKYFLAHWYEMGSNVIDHISKKWEMEYIGMNKEIDQPWADSIPWIKGKPFRMFEHPGTSTNNPDFRGSNPVYYSDFVTVNGNRFFNCFTEIRDVAGYEWYPDNDVLPSAQRGIRQLRRALSSMAMAVLFTHENVTIYEIQPEIWEAQLKMIAEGISDFKPMMMTSEDAIKIVKAHQTSRLSGCSSNLSTNTLNLSLKGEADTLNYAYYFTEKNGEIIQKMIEFPSFEGEVNLQISEY